GRCAKPAVIDGQYAVAHGRPALNTKHTAVQVPSRAVQVKYGGCAGIGGGQVPGLQPIAVVLLDVKHLGSLGRLTPPAAFPELYRKNGRALPAVKKNIRACKTWQQD